MPLGNRRWIEEEGSSERKNIAGMCDFVHKLIGESSPNVRSVEPTGDGYERSIATSQSSYFDAGVCGGDRLVRAGLSEDGAPSSAWQ